MKTNGVDGNVKEARVGVTNLGESHSVKVSNKQNAIFVHLHYMVMREIVRKMPKSIKICFEDTTYPPCAYGMFVVVTWSVMQSIWSNLVIVVSICNMIGVKFSPGVIIFSS